MYTVYLLRCCNQSLYCGYTTDLSRRVFEHLYAKTGAKYTKRFPPIAIAAAWVIDSDLSHTLKIEHAIKALTKQAKEKLVVSQNLASCITHINLKLTPKEYKSTQLKAIWGKAIQQKEVNNCL